MTTREEIDKLRAVYIDLSFLLPRDGGEARIMNRITNTLTEVIFDLICDQPANKEGA